MKNCEQELKKLIELSNGGCDPVYQGTAEMTEAQLRFLAAKGLISLIPAGDDEFYAVIEPAGLAYFSNKEDNPEGKMLEQLKKIADAAQEQANAAKDQARLAKEKAESASKESHEAKRQSKISNVIAILLLLLPFWPGLFPEKWSIRLFTHFFNCISQMANGSSNTDNCYGLKYIH